jgi:hypothetical protein
LVSNIDAGERRMGGGVFAAPVVTVAGEWDARERAINRRPRRKKVVELRWTRRPDVASGRAARASVTKGKGKRCWILASFSPLLTLLAAAVCVLRVAAPFVISNYS